MWKDFVRNTEISKGNARQHVEDNHDINKIVKQHTVGKAYMIKSLMTPGTRRFFLFILIPLLVTDLAILLDIPILRPLLGFLFFTIIPGFLILHILKLNRLGLTERFVLSVGLSVTFLMFVGLLINSVCLPLGYATPLSTGALIISFSIILIILAVIGYKRNTDFSFNLSSFKLDTREKTFLLLPALFLPLSILGMHIMNTANNNMMLMVMLFLIPAHVILIAILHHRVPQRIYPVMLFLIGVSLLLLVSLRSSHIIGNDTHGEYYLFQLVSSTQHWQNFMKSILDACLSITLLPAIYQSLMNINPEYLFKILYSVLFSVSPLAIYIICKKYLGNFYAFLASFFFMSQFFFIWTAGHARNNMALLFFALVIMVLFSDGISEFAKKFLIILFAASCIVSHYSTTYIFFFMLLFTWIVMQILTSLTLRRRKSIASSGSSITRSHSLDLSTGGSPVGDSVNASGSTTPSIPKFRLNKGITITFVLLFFTIIFFWYSQVVPVTFRSGVSYIYRTFSNLNQMFILETRGAAVAEAYGQTLAYSEIPARLKFVFSWLGIATIATGVLSTIVRYKRMVSIPGAGADKPNFLKLKIDTEYWVLSLVCCAILGLAFLLPYALYGYGMGGTFFQMTVVLSMFFVIGSIVAAKFLKSKPYWVMLAILIPYFLCNSGAIDRIFGAPGTVVLNSEGPSHAYYYIYDQEGYATRWLRDNASPKGTAIYSDRGGAVRLVSQGRVTSPRIGLYSSLEQDKKIDGYIYLTYHNVVNRELLDNKGNVRGIEKYQDKFTGRSKIYANGGSEIYR